ncbi:retrotransposon protein, putative, ty1-copia subclass [Tanacetum coccineum]
MRALLIQHGCEAALEVLPEDMKTQAKTELNKKAHSVVILCLGNKVLREVTGETTVAGVWSKLETLYMTKLLAYKLYLKKKLYTFCMPVGVKIFEHIDEFNKIVLDLANTEVKFEDEDPLLIRKELIVEDSQQSIKGNSRSKSRGGRPSAIFDNLRILLKRNRCSYHMTPRLDILLRISNADGGKCAGKARAVWQEKTRRGRTVKKLRTDNGLEFCNQEYEQLCIESGIARHLTVFGLPKTFWAEATYTAAYLINTLPSRAIEKKTPMEMWSGHPSDYGMLRIFSCVAYPHDKQGKLEPRVIKCVLLGYPEGVKGYRLYRLDGESHKIVTRMNVVFNESVMNKDTLKDSADGDDEDAGDHETDQTPDLTDYQLARDRERRTRTKPLRFQDESNMVAYAFVAAEEEYTHEPLTYQETVAYEDSSKCKVAMEEEMDYLRKNKTWELVDHPAGQKLVICIWLFKIKEWIEGVQKPRYKARLVARGFTQRADYELEHLDVKTAFLHGNLKEQSPRQWYRRFDEYMLSNGFKRSSYNSCIGSTKSLLKKEFDMNELGEAKEDSWYGDRQGSESQDSRWVTIRVKNCDVERMSKVPYSNAVGSLMYLMVSNVAKHKKMLKSQTTMKNPTSQHAENYSLHSYATNQPTLYRDHQTQPPLPVEFSSKSLKVSVDRGHFLEGVERLFSAWATRFNDNEKVQQLRALLIQHGCEAALEVLHEDMKAQAKTDLNKKAHSVVILCLGIVILCLGNKVLRDVTEETTAEEVWSKLETFWDNDKVISQQFIPSKKKFVYILYAQVGGDGGDERTGSARLDQDFRMSNLMTPQISIYFIDFLENALSSVQLGDNKECKIKSIDKVRVQLKDGRAKSRRLMVPRVILSSNNEGIIGVNTLDGHAMAGCSWAKQGALLARTKVTSDCPFSSYKVVASPPRSMYNTAASPSVTNITGIVLTVALIQTKKLEDMPFILLSHSCGRSYQGSVSGLLYIDSCVRFNSLYTLYGDEVYVECPDSCQLNKQIAC